MNKGNYFNYSLFKSGFMLFVALCFSFTFNHNVYGSSGWSVSSFSFSSIRDFASGLVDDFSSMDRRDSSDIHNISNGVKQGMAGFVETETNDLIVLGTSFLSHARGIGALNYFDEQEDDSHIKPAVEKSLFYPNPFRQSLEEGAVLSYQLSKDFTFEIHIYNMLAQRVFKQTYIEGGEGARKGQNLLRINKNSFGGYLLSAGVYFYVFVSEGNVLSKGKVVIKP